MRATSVDGGGNAMRGDRAGTPSARAPLAEASGWHHARNAPPESGPSGVAQRISRADNIDAEIFKLHMSDDLSHQALGAALMPLLVGVCWPHVSSSALLVWLVAATCVAAMRLFATRIYENLYEVSDAATKATYTRYFTAVWVARGLIWGASVSLFFDRLPIDRQYLCWMIVITAIGFPITVAALRPTAMRVYLLAAFSAAACAVAYRFASMDSVAHYDLFAVPLPMLVLLLLLHIGVSIHGRTRERLELVYDRTRLIDLLGTKKEQAEQAVRVKNRFLASAAHDMRQPVMALSLYAEHLVLMPNEHLAVVPKIARAAAAVNRLFDSLFDLARMDNGQTTLRIEPVDISEIMHDLLVQFEPMAAEKSIRLRMRTGHFRLMTDPVRTRRMIGNLVSNAIKYSPAGSRVLMSARVRANTVVIEVWDQGIGIPPTQLESCFLEFYKADNAPENSEGFGLGLSIVSRLAHALNSQLSVRSELGRGSVFRIVMKSVDTDCETHISRAVG